MKYLIATASLLYAIPVCAQAVAVPEQQAAVIVEPVQQNILRSGAEVPLTLREELTTE